MDDYSVLRITSFDKKYVVAERCIRKALGRR